MSLFSKLFGGTDSKALDAQAETNTATGKKLAELGERARADIINLFPKASDARNTGLEAAFGVLAEVIPEQARVFKEGNEQAQATQAMGLTGINRALLGKPLDLSGPTTRQAVQSIDFNMTPESIKGLFPQFQDPTSGVQPQASPGSFDLSQFLNGQFRSGF